ncbi:MAG: outer membrane lipoprotein carrier protein LolA [Bacteroidota bacterium]
MKKYYFLALLIGTIRLAWAGPAHEMAAHLLDRIGEQKNFRATFTYHIQSDQKESSEKKLVGSITVQGHQYRLSIGGQEIISDGTTVWTYLPDANEVQINAYDPEQGASAPWLLFTNWRQTHEFYDLSDQIIYSKRGGCYKRNDGNGTYDIYLTATMVAKASENTIQKLVITGNRGRLDIKRLEVLDSNQQWHRFSVTKFKTSLALDDAFFKFMPENYAGIEVIDMR